MSGLFSPVRKASALSYYHAKVKKILLFFFASFGHLIWMLNALSGFDKFINKDNYPDYYRKGLRKEA